MSNYEKQIQKLNREAMCRVSVVALFFLFFSILIGITYFKNKKNNLINSGNQLVKLYPDTLNNRWCKAMFQYCVKSKIENKELCYYDLKKCLKRVD